MASKLTICMLMLTTTALIISEVDSSRGINTAAPAGPSKSSNSTTTDIGYLPAQNKARAAVGVQPLKWSAKLADEAVRTMKNRTGCGFADVSLSLYGSNQAWTGFAASPVQAVQIWVDQGKYYVRANNTCVVGHDCLTYTQVVWRKSMEAGCAQDTCEKTRENGSMLTLCFYDPHGNVVGESPY